jgi:hypothetical protein
VAITDAQPLGMVSGRLRIELPEYHRDISLAVGGLLLNRDTVVKDLDEKADKGNPQSAQTTQNTPVDLGKALRSATKRVDPADPPGHGPLLKWSVANEGLVYGYLIYRGDSEAGPFVRVNDEIIRAMNEDGSSEYKWRDASAVSGRTYWYYIGVLKQSGVRQDLSGPQKVVAR